MGEFLRQQWLAMIALGLGAYAVVSMNNQSADLERRIDALANRRVAAPPAATPGSMAPPTKAPPRGAATVGPADKWDCKGKLKPEEIREVIGASGSQVFLCYQAAQADKPELAGSLALTMRVDGQGRVSDTKLSGTLEDEEVTECVTQLARDWRFPKPTEGDCTVVTAPFSFAPPAGKTE